MAQTLSKTVNGVTYIATPNAATTTAQTQAALSSGWSTGTPTSAPSTLNAPAPVTITSSGLNTPLNSVTSSLPTASYANAGPVNNAGLTNPMSTSGFTLDKNNQWVYTAPNNSGDNYDPNVLNLKNSYIPKKENVYQSPEIQNQNAVINSRQSELNSLTSQLNNVVSEQNQRLLATRQTGSREGVTEGVYGNQERAINYDAAIRALPLQAAIATAKDNLKLAQDYLSQLVTIKNEQATNDYNYKVAQYNAISEFVDKSEQKRLDTLKIADERTYQEKLNNIKQQWDWSTEAAKYGQGNLIPLIQSLDPSASDFNQRLGNITSKLVNPNAQIETKLKNQQYANEVLQGQKLKQEIEANKPVTGEYASVINGAAGLVPSTKSKVTKLNIANAIASNNFPVAYAEIANAVSDGLTGTNKTKFDDARTDIGVMTGMRDAIENYVNAGGDVNYLKGTADALTKKFGTLSTDPKFAALGVQLTREFQSYRNNMTGAAFSPQESREYASVNPRTNASLDLNLATIDGALNQLTNRVTSTVNARLPEAQKIYSKIINNNNDPLNLGIGQTNSNNPLGI